MVASRYFGVNFDIYPGSQKFLDDLNCLQSWMGWIECPKTTFNTPNIIEPMKESIFNPQVLHSSRS